MSPQATPIPGTFRPLPGRAARPAAKPVPPKGTILKPLPNQKPAVPSVLGVGELRPSPEKYSTGWFADEARRARDWLVNQLPAAGGMGGGIVGLTSGAETGPGAVGTAMLGAGAGGAAGEAAKERLMEWFHPQMPKPTAGEAAVKIVGQGALQSLNEVVGDAILGPMMSRAVQPITKSVPDSLFTRFPFLKTVLAKADQPSARAVQHLTAAASEKGATADVAHEAIARTLGDIQSEMQKTGGKTVGDFLGAVNARKVAMNNESAVAMLPIAGKKVVPTGIADSVRNLSEPWMANTAQGRAEQAYIKRRAAEFDKPWSFRDLDRYRTYLSSQLAKHKAKDVVARYTAEKGDIDLAIDNAILGSLRDTVYPEMDRAAGKPAGYFENLKGRQSSLIELQSILDRRIKRLGSSQAISEARPRLGSENLSIYMHAGGGPRAYLHGLKEAVAPTRELSIANRQVRKAFPSVNSLPYQILFSQALRAEEAKKEGQRQ